MTYNSLAENLGAVRKSGIRRTLLAAASLLAAVPMGGCQNEKTKIIQATGPIPDFVHRGALTLRDIATGSTVAVTQATCGAAPQPALDGFLANGSTPTKTICDTSHPGYDVKVKDSSGNIEEYYSYELNTTATPPVFYGYVAYFFVGTTVDTPDQILVESASD